MKLKSNGMYLYLADDNGESIGTQRGLTVKSYVNEPTTVTVTFVNEIEVDGKIELVESSKEYKLKNNE